MAVDQIQTELESAREALSSLLDGDASERVGRIAATIADSLRAGGKVMACGNGGSSADAMHFCEELTGRYRGDRPALGAIACVDPGHLTCTANDYGYEMVFSRWVEALGRPGDVLVALTTSGKSRNVLRAVEAAGAIGMKRVAMLGGDGGVLRGLCEHEIVAPGGTADRVQELHMLMLHCVIGEIERRLGVA
ncbi:MAG: phosphoheptose isomerase [Phycisphaerae bacterium]|nr:phosphoheptose isomerase [Phycisphaerae bacterium]